MANNQAGVPIGAPLLNDDGTVSLAYADWFNRINRVAGTVNVAGFTGQRPSAGVNVGYQFWDTSTNKLLIASQVTSAYVVWRDTLGNIVS